ncbi:MAG: hypothetical protein LBJ63_05315 [Prevotellaceae bacterium]|jgi:hypothetical protein|nr:hypothetical protein [Prevotellaceae bacterium]
MAETKINEAGKVIETVELNGRQGIMEVMSGSAEDAFVSEAGKVVKEIEIDGKKGRMPVVSIQGGGVSPEVLKGYVKEVPNPEIVGSEIVETNVKAGQYTAMGVASNGKTYFCGYGFGIKVLNKDTGIIEDTNVTTGGYFVMGIASNGKTYFCANGVIKVLDDETGAIENTNITVGSYGAMGIASDGRTYFISATKGIMVLQHTYSDETYVRIALPKLSEVI